METETKKRILVIDDELQDRKDYYETALKERYEVVYTENAENIINVIRKSKVDLYIVDLNLDGFPDPIGKGSLTVDPILRAIGTYKPVILLSASYKELVEGDKLTPIINKCIEEGYNICTFLTWADIIKASKDVNGLGNRDILYGEIDLSLSKDRVQYDFGLVCALEEEFEPFKNLVSIENIERISGITYRKGSLKTNNGRVLKFVAACPLSMGIADSCIIATHMASLLKVKTIYMIGVCGGREKEEVKIGDIIVPIKSIAFQRGKLTEKGFSSDIQIAKPKEQGLIRSDNANNILEELFYKYTSDYIQKYRCTLDLKVPHIHYQTMACADYVIDKDGELDTIAQNTAHRKLCAVDMESYAIFRVGEILDVDTMVIKAVMDLTSKKGDKYKAYAAYMAANYLYQLLYREEITFSHD